MVWKVASASSNISRSISFNKVYFRFILMLKHDALLLSSNRNNTLVSCLIYYTSNIYIYISTNLQKAQLQPLLHQLPFVLLLLIRSYEYILHQRLTTCKIIPFYQARQHLHPWSYSKP